MKRPALTRPALVRPVLVRSAPFLLATGLLAASLPVGGAQAAGVRSGKEPAFSGYSTQASATPIKLELYEPMIPIPATPQLELSLGYSVIEAASGTSMGRGSWLWPGDPVGEGLKTFVEQLGLPPELGQNGYPVQVNSSAPGGESSHADEPFPGLVMRTSSSDKETVARVGFSPDGDVESAPGDGSTPGLPGLPGLSGAPGGADDPLAQLSGILSGAGLPIAGLLPGAGGGGAAPQDEGGTPPNAFPGLPPELTALVDVAGLSSVSRTVTSGDEVRTTARSALGEVSLLGGVITLEGVVARSESASDGRRATARSSSEVGAITIAGQRFAFGSEGLEVPGAPAEIPGLPDDPAEALAALGVRLVMPKATKTVKGESGAATAEGLQVILDVPVLKGLLKDVPLQALVDAVPASAGELKNALSLLAGLAPKVVLTLGTAATETETVQGLDIPEVDPGDLPEGGADGSGGGGASAAAPGAGSGTAGTAGTPGTEATPGAGGAGAGEAPVDTRLTSAGLPDLTTIPGALTLGGILGAIAAGSWLRRIGAIVLGGGGACSHGFETGLPDLRKA